jgi:putative DNA primase/helicase
MAAIKHWWGRRYKDANIGLATGQGCWVLDVDCTQSSRGDLTLESLSDTHGPLPTTPQVHTGGGGWHYYFRLPTTGTIGNRVKFAPGLDTRAAGGLVILPPSQHASGVPYVWDTEADLESTPLAEAPAWLLDLLGQPPPHTAPPIPDDAPIPDGTRSDTLSKMAFAMRKAGMSLAEILTALTAVNARCVPPLTAAELQGIVDGKKDIHPDPVFTFTTNGAAHGAMPPTAWPAGTPWETLRTTHYGLHAWHIKDLIRHGLTIIGGAPKAAKSYIAHDIALATLGQGLALGYWGCMPGGVLYCAVEDDEADSKDRVFELRPTMPDALDHPFLFVNMDAVPTFSQDLCGYVRHMVTTHALSLVIIDPLLYVYDLAIPRGKDPFQALQAALLPFRQLAIDLHIALIFVDHRRKSSRDDIDIFETLYGSRAKEAIADTLMMVERHEHELMISTKGRKIEQQIFHFGFHLEETPTGQRTFTWHFDGLGAHRVSGARTRMVLQAFANARAAGHFELDARAVIDYAEEQQAPTLYNSVRQALFQLRRKGLLIRARNGLFVVANPSMLPPAIAPDFDPGVTV